MRQGIGAQVSLRWGAVVLGTTRLRGRQGLSLGDGGTWALPAEMLGEARFELLRPRGDGLVLAVPPNATAWVSGSRAGVRMGALAVDLEMTADEPRRSHRSVRLGAWMHQVASAAAHIGLLALLAIGFPRLGTDEPDAETARDRTLLLMRALDASAARERDLVTPSADDSRPPAPGEGGDARRAGGTGTRALGEEGSPGSSITTSRVGHLALRGASHEPHLSRAAAIEEAARFGIIGLVATMQGSGSASSPWEPDPGEGRDVTTSRAPLWGATLDDAFSSGGLGLTGTGEGAGGRGEGIGIGKIGTLGTAGGCSCGMGGEGFGRLGRGHRVRFEGGGGDGTTVNGRLPPETIQRIVRQNMGRFRLCYERALERRPDLSGRVVTRFVIGRDGGVAFAADAGSDLPDADVVSCIVRSFQALSFPEPTGGVVTVEYPLMMTRAE